MPEDTTPAPTRPWYWPAAWMREEKFWRDIGTRVLAGVMTAAIIYGGALLLGYLHSPEIGAGLLLALGIAGGGLLIAVAAGLIAGLPARVRTGRPFAARITVAAVLVVAAVSLVVAIVADLLRG